MKQRLMSSCLPLPPSIKFHRVLDTQRGLKDHQDSEPRAEPGIWSRRLREDLAPRPLPRSPLLSAYARDVRKQSEHRVPLVLEAEKRFVPLPNRRRPVRRRISLRLLHKYGQFLPPYYATLFSISTYPFQIQRPCTLYPCVNGSDWHTALQCIFYSVAYFIEY